MTLFPDNIEMFANEYDSDLKVQYQAPKLPFDVNDYLNFELNEDLILANGDFANDYATSSSDSERSIINSLWDEHDHEEIGDQQIMGPVDKVEQNDLTYMAYKNELFGNDDYEDDNNDISRCGELDEAFAESQTPSNTKVFNQGYDDDYMNNEVDSDNNYILNSVDSIKGKPDTFFISITCLQNPLSHLIILFYNFLYDG
ncbi:hypothetical protein BN7_122 [Wickerhamomyces ciferrii]|uniref:Uncharacterized protein n=1 Tax=Wickerhamomyces ciferrii (strain ATCC 14091 / BCRC 22168 / CBS 111 / JCM 3599 / NBRC 0793 / NRRL Y-1031 F-60-10) TaxID=1206466 RepID=K0KGP1_WICCF|nr:uncharacterized protein BN7_122 [Wickerhamomyces ciferrii]CCH40589.1 hypothetical protein BN7_122 [Wickerhamomyces ciferrii]